MLRLWQRVQSILNAVTDPRSRFPPIAYAVVVSDCETHRVTRVYGFEDMVRDMRILLGVPKYRTTKPKKQTRKFSYTRLLSPTKDLVACTSCGSLHQMSTICGECYAKVRELTNEIKREMMSYNPYKGGAQDKEVIVRFSNDNVVDDGVLNGKRIIEIEKERPTWFKKLF